MENNDFELALKMLEVMEDCKIKKFKIGHIEIEMEHLPEAKTWVIPPSQSLEVKPVTDDDILNNPLAGLSIDPFSRKED